LGSIFATGDRMRKLPVSRNPISGIASEQENEFDLRFPSKYAEKFLA
jgi:hypothetical protein